MIPALEEANAISEELDKKVKFEIVVLSAKARGLTSGRTEVEHVIICQLKCVYTQQTIM